MNEEKEIHHWSVEEEVDKKYIIAALCAYKNWGNNNIKWFIKDFICYCKKTPSINYFFIDDEEYSLLLSLELIEE